MVRAPTALLVVVGAAVALSSTSSASAEPPARTAPPASADGSVHHFVFGQALAVLIRRLSVGYELLLPGTHHSFGITVHGQWPGTKYLTVADGEVAGVGGEIGYRYYAGEHGLSGPFFGVSFLTGHYYSRASFYEEDPRALWYTQYGWAIDMGWATYLDHSTVLAIAAGVQRTWISVERSRITDQAELSNGEGLRPRAQIQVGRIF